MVPEMTVPYVWIEELVNGMTGWMKQVCLTERKGGGTGHYLFGFIWRWNLSHVRLLMHEGSYLARKARGCYWVLVHAVCVGGLVCGGPFLKYLVIFGGDFHLFL